MIKNLFNYVSFSLSALSMIFLLPAMAGEDADVAWSTLSRNQNGCDELIVAGLLKYASSSSCTKGSELLVRYDSDTCKNALNGDPCDKCNETGKAVLSFLVFGFIGLLAVIAGQVLRYTGMKFELMHKALLAATASGTSVCFFLCWTSWAGGCNTILQDESRLDSFSIRLAAGWGLTFMNFLFLGAICFLELLFTEDFQTSEKKAMPGTTVGGSVPGALGNPSQVGLVQTIDVKKRDSIDPVMRPAQEDLPQSELAMTDVRKRGGTEPAGLRQSTVNDEKSVRSTGIDNQFTNPPGPPPADIDDGVPHAPPPPITIAGVKSRVPPPVPKRPA